MSKRDSFLNTKPIRIYDDCTLIGNWIENRAAAEKSIPLNQRKQELKLSEYNEKYANPAKENDLNEIFTDSYVQGFRNRARGHQSSVKFFNADQFLTNLCTTNDIYYRIKAGRNKCGQVVWEPLSSNGFDALRSFGNATDFGMRKWITEREKKLQDIPVDVSYTRDFYKCPRKRDYAHIVKKRR